MTTPTEPGAGQTDDPHSAHSPTADPEDHPSADLAGLSRWNADRSLSVGTRVVVRKRLAPGESSHLLTDVIGYVLELEPDLVVRRADGETVAVPHRDIQVLKVLPPRPVRAREIRELEFTSALSWPGTDFALVDGWLCRAGDDWSYRRNSAVPVQPWASTTELDRVRDWYSTRDLPLRFAAVDRLADIERLTLDGGPVDPARLSGAAPLHVCTGQAQRLVEVGAAVASDGFAAIELVDRPDDDWLSLYHGTAGMDPQRVRPALMASAALAEGEPVAGGHVVFARLESSTPGPDGSLAGIARGTVTAGPSGEPKLGISCVETSPGFRRRGVAELVTAALGAWGLSLGAKECHLHVFDSNTAGRGLWGKVGLAPHHSVSYVQVD